MTNYVIFDQLYFPEHKETMITVAVLIIEVELTCLLKFGQTPLFTLNFLLHNQRFTIFHRYKGSVTPPYTSNSYSVYSGKLLHYGQ